MEFLTMRKILRAAVIAVPAAMAAVAPVQSAQANPMVAVGWLWAAGLGGLALGFLGGNAYASNRVVVPAAVPVEAAAVPNYGNCQPATIRYHGRMRHVLICD
jgi:hypothetical protein